MAERQRNRHLVAGHCGESPAFPRRVAREACHHRVGVRVPGGDGNLLPGLGCEVRFPSDRSRAADVLTLGGRGVERNEDDLVLDRLVMTREPYLQPAVSEEVALDRDITAGQSFWRQVLVRQEREPTEAEAPVE